MDAAAPSNGDTAFDADAFFADLFDLAVPQPKYRALLAAGPVHTPSAGFAVAASRAAVEETLRDPARFAAEGLVELGNVRPLIPLSVDPPLHVKYRKILDPLFAPKRMEAQEDDITARVNHFIDSFVDRGACHFTDEFAIPFPSSVFLGLMGLPWDELATLLRLKDGIMRPARGRRRRAEPDPPRHRAGDLRVLRGDPRRTHAPTPRRHPHAVPDVRDRRREADSRGDPRHLLPVPHRRPRHRHRHAHVLLRVPRRAPRPSPPAGRRPVADPGGGGGAAALGDAGAERVPPGDRRHGDRRLSDQRRFVRRGQPRRGQRRRVGVSRPVRGPLRPRRQPPSRVRRRRAPLPRLASRASGAARARCGSGIAGSRSTSSSPGSSCTIRSVCARSRISSCGGSA